MIKQRVKAFTILEVTITMLIASLLIGITYTSYSIVVKSYLSFKNNNDNIAVLNNLDYILKSDFNKADIILKDTDGISIINEKQIIKYNIGSNFIIRKASRVDTIKVQIEAVSMLFENAPIYDLLPINEQNRVDKLQFVLLFRNKKIPYQYNKVYSSINLINRKPNANN